MATVDGIKTANWLFLGEGGGKTACCFCSKYRMLQEQPHTLLRADGKSLTLHLEVSLCNDVQSQPFQSSVNGFSLFLLGLETTSPTPWKLPVLVSN